MGCAFMDRFIMDSLKQRMRQIVMIGSGMDCRVFRMELPPQMTVIEVDEAHVHEAKCSVLDAHGARSRCLVRRQALGSTITDLRSSDLVDAIQPAHSMQKPTLFLLDGALHAWPAEARMPAVSAAASLAAPGSVIVGPAPDEDTSSVLHEAGFGQVNIINHHQLSQIYRRAIPESMGMLVAIHGEAKGAGKGATRGGGCAGKGKSGGVRSGAREIKF